MRVQLTLVTGVQVAIGFTRVSDSRQLQTTGRGPNLFNVFDAIHCEMETVDAPRFSKDQFFGSGYSYRTREDFCAFSWQKGCEVAMQRAMEYVTRDNRKMVWEAWKQFVQRADANHRSLPQQAAHEEADRNRKPKQIAVEPLVVPPAPMVRTSKIADEEPF